jgi:uncharacterized protein (TIGR00295 family)
MNSLPSPDECLQYLQLYGCSQAVINHCLAVRNLAVEIGRYANANIALVEVGALLHDIGRGKTHGIRHAVTGAEIARELHLPTEIVNIIERHLGAGIPREEAIALGLPEKDYLPVTLEEKIVTHADNLIENNEKVPISFEIQKAENKQQHSHAQRLRILHDELSQICGIDLDNL